MPECECELAGFCARRNVKVTAAHHAHCQAGHVEAVDRFYSQPRAPQANDKSQLRNIAKPFQRVPGIRIGTALEARIKRLTGVGPTGTCGCRQLAAQMDMNGPRWVEKNRAFIIDTMVSDQNKEELVKALAGEESIKARVASWVAKTPFGDDALRLGAEWLLDRAVADATAAKPVRRVTRVHRSKSDSPLAPEWNVPLGTWQSTIRHLTYHVWATKKHDTWQWNLQQLAKRWALFNGTKILAVVSDADSHPAPHVCAYAESLGMKFDHIVARPNNPKKREVVTWLPMLEILNPQQAGPNEVVFAAHAKGVRHNTQGDHLMHWADTMYRTCLDDWPRVEQQLSQFLATGSYKRYGSFNTVGNNRWHYSGTFFWWRLAEIGRRNWRKVDSQFFGSESWIGHQCYRNETGVLFHDNCGDLYKPEYWRDSVWPDWNNYEPTMGQTNAVP